MTTEIVQYLLYLLAGIGAGVMNTLAGGGSMFVMSVLLFLGVPSNMANGTNSLGILVQNFTGAVTFYKGGFLDVKKAVFYGVPAVIGAFLGSMVATFIEEGILDWVVCGLMLFALFFLIKDLVVKKPAKPAFPVNQKKSTVRSAIEIIIFLFAGFQAGFVQAGMGVMLIIILNAFTALSIVRVNAIKMVIIGFFSIPVFAVFASEGLILWPAAIALAVGQVFGTWLTSRFFLGNKKIGLVTDWIVIVVVIISITKTLFLK